MSGNSVELIRSDRPAERLTESRPDPGDTAPERAPRSLGTVDDRDQLEVRLTERHDPVRRPLTRVTAALHRRQAAPRLDLQGRSREVGDRDQYMVELQKRAA